MPRFASTIKSLLMNKEKLPELAKIPLNENCSAMLLKKLPEKLGDPGKFLIPCNFQGIDTISAIEDTWERRGIANMAFIQLGGSSRVGEMILARERSGFAEEKVWDDIQVVTRFWGGKEDFLGE
ncbi:hypothetical protein Tco_0246049 [Tanacetum coccineum]